MPEILSPQKIERARTRAKLKAGTLVAGLALALSAELKPASAEQESPVVQKPEFIIGAMEDSVLSEDYKQSEAVAGKIAEMGFNTLKVSLPWTHPGQCAEIDNDLARFQNAARAAKNNGLYFMLNLIPGGGNGLGMAPTTHSQRRCYKDTLISYLHAFEQVSPGGHLLLEVLNEANSETFFRPQFNREGEWTAPQDSTKILAGAYEPLKQEAAALNIRLTIAGIGLASKRRPQQFIQEMGKAKREAREGKLMDMLTHHPYGNENNEPLETVHAEGGTIGFGDLGRLANTVDESLAEGLPIGLSEFGLRTKVPASELDQYKIFPNSAKTLVNEATQAEYYAQAIRLARCHPRIGALVLFNIVDDRDGYWTSGTFYPDMTPKSSYSRVKRAIEQAKSASPGCENQAAWP